MPSTKDIELFDSGMFLFKGENGTGKTGAAASFHLIKPGAKVFFFDFDGKMNTVKHMFPTIDVQYESYGINNFGAFLNDFEKLQTNCPYDVIVVDSLTTLTMTLVIYMLQKKGDNAKVPADQKDGQGRPKILAGGIQVTTWDEVNGETVLVGKMLEISKILSAMKGKYVIWTAHPIERTAVVDGKVVRSRPITCYGNKVNYMVPSYFSEIYHFGFEKKGFNKDNTVKNSRVIHTQTVEDDFAKSSLGLPEIIDWTNKFNFCNILKAEFEKAHPGEKKFEKVTELIPKT